MEPVNRRGFIVSGAAGISGVTALWQAADRAQARPLDASPRQVLSMNRNWLYGGRAVPGCAAADFDDSKFQRVTIPHTNKSFPWHSFDEKDFQFISIYRRHFKLPAELKGRNIFVDFAGVMTAATVTINGTKLGENAGGYRRSSFALRPPLNWNGPNVLAVEGDPTERADIPPFGGEIDYLTFGGIYREVSLRAVPNIHLENIFAKPVDVLSDGRRVGVKCFLSEQAGSTRPPLTLKVELRDGNRTLATAAQEVPASGGAHMVTLANLGAVDLWHLEHPKLYQVVARLEEGQKVIDEHVTRIGFREARFTPRGFLLNGKHIKLRGLNRHQTFPFVGGAMPARVQRRDALILKNELKCNIVRTSHYPQSTHFLDA